MPYPIFSYTALVPWTYFAGAITDSTNSLVQNSSLLTKVYFPRLVLPLAAVLGKLVDFMIAMTLVFAIMAWYWITTDYHVVPSILALAIPLLVLIMVVTAAGVGMFMTALAVQFRDIKHAMTFLLQGLMYISPVVYPVSAIPEQYQNFYALNPMVGVIEGFRAALIGGSNPMPWTYILIGGVVSLLSLVIGAMYFRRAERNFADVA